jgi:uncharacterized FlaG/YvyC family protein
MNIASMNSTVPVGPADLPSTRAITGEQRSVIRAVTAVNASGTFGQDNEVTYSVDRAAGMVVVKLVNKSDGRVLQQIPAEYLLRMAEELNRG